MSTVSFFFRWIIYCFEQGTSRILGICRIGGLSQKLSVVNVLAESLTNTLRAVRRHSFLLRPQRRMLQGSNKDMFRQTVACKLKTSSRAKLSGPYLASRGFCPSPFNSSSYWSTAPQGVFSSSSQRTTWQCFLLMFMRDSRNWQR